MSQAPKLDILATIRKELDELTEADYANFAPKGKPTSASHIVSDSMDPTTRAYYTLWQKTHYALLAVQTDGDLLVSRIRSGLVARQSRGEETESLVKDGEAKVLEMANAFRSARRRFSFLNEILHAQVALNYPEMANRTITFYEGGALGWEDEDDIKGLVANLRDLLSGTDASAEAAGE